MLWQPFGQLDLGVVSSARSSCGSVATQGTSEAPETVTSVSPLHVFTHSAPVGAGGTPPFREQTAQHRHFFTLSSYGNPVIKGMAYC